MNHNTAITEPQTHPPKAAVRLAPFALGCDKPGCSAVADTVHLFDTIAPDAGPIRIMSAAEFLAVDFPPEPDAVLRILAACPTHNPRGYCVQLNDDGAGLWDEGPFGWDDWAWHLTNKPGDWWAPLLRWLQERQAMTSSENAAKIDPSVEWEDLTLQTVNADTCFFCGVPGHDGNCKAEWLELAAAARDKGATLMPIPATATCPWCRIAGGHADTCPVKPATAKPKPFTMLPQEFMAQTPEKVEWVLEPFIGRGDLVELDGEAKRAGKSTLVWNLIKAMTTGADFLGGATLQGHVVVLSEMAGGSLGAQLLAADIHAAENLHLVLYNEHGFEPWESIAAQAIAACKEFDAVLLVVDTLPKWAKIRGDEGNSAGQWLERMEHLEPLHGSGTAVVLLCHDRKSGGAVGVSGAGSASRVGAVDTVLQLTRTSGDASQRKLEVISRHPSTPEIMLISLTSEGYVVDGNQPDATKVALEDHILSVLADDKPWTEAQLILTTGGTRSTVQRALEWLTDSSSIRKTAGGPRAAAEYRIVRVGSRNQVSKPVDHVNTLGI